MAGIFYKFIIIPVYEKASTQNTLLIFIADKINGLLFHHEKKLNNSKENEEIAHAFQIYFRVYAVFGETLSTIDKKG